MNVVVLVSMSVKHCQELLALMPIYAQEELVCMTCHLTMLEDKNVYCCSKWRHSKNSFLEVVKIVKRELLTFSPPHRPITARSDCECQSVVFIKVLKLSEAATRNSEMKTPPTGFQAQWASGFARDRAAL